MNSDPLQLSPLNHILVGLLAGIALIIAAVGWWEAMNLDLDRSMVFARPGHPIKTGWQPIALGVTSIIIGGGVALGILRRGITVARERLFLGLLFVAMSAIAVFGMAGVYAGIEAFALLEQAESPEVY